MTIYLHGGDLASYAVTAGPDGTEVHFAPGVRLWVWVSPMGDERITDLTDIDGQPITEVVVSDGTDGWQLGAIRPFRAPYPRVWVGVEGQPRVLSVTNDLPELIDQATAAAEGAREAAQAAAASAAELAESSSIAGHEAAPDPHPGYLTPARGDQRYVPRRLVTEPLDEPIQIIDFTSQPPVTAGNITEIWVTHQGTRRMTRWDNERGLYRAEQVPGALYENLITLVTAYNGTGRAVCVQQRGPDNIRRDVGGIDARGRVVTSDQAWAPITVDPDGTGRYAASTALGPAPLGARYEADDVVRAQGRIQASSVVAGDTIAVTPAGYHPLSARMVLLPTDAGPLPVELRPTGRIVALANMTGPVEISLDDLTWARVAAPQPGGDWTVETAGWATPSSSSPLTITHTSQPALYLLIVAATSATADITGVTDDGGNTWARLAYAPTSGAVGRRIEAWACQPSTPFGAVWVAHDETATVYATMIEITGHDTATPVDQVAAEVRSATSTPAALTVTPSGAGRLVISAIMANPNQVSQMTPSPGWSALSTHPGGPAVVYLIDPPPAAPVGVEWSLVNSSGSGHVIIALNPRG